MLRGGVGGRGGVAQGWMLTKRWMPRRHAKGRKADRLIVAVARWCWVPQLAGSWMPTFFVGVHRTDETEIEPSEARLPSSAVRGTLLANEVVPGKCKRNVPTWSADCTWLDWTKNHHRTSFKLIHSRHDSGSGSRTWESNSMPMFCKP